MFSNALKHRLIFINVKVYFLVFGFLLNYFQKRFPDNNGVSCFDILLCANAWCFC